MYLPRHFREDRLDVLYEVLAAHEFALVMAAMDDGRIEVAHVPVQLDRDGGRYGTLRAHVARANPLARRIAASSPVTVVFQGPHGYVSPAWFGDRNAVPTWNYVAVHAAGVARPLADAATLRQLERLVETYEARREDRWRIAELDPERLATLTQALLAFEVPIERLEGKVKLSQNKPLADRQGVIAGLRREQGAAGEALARWMERYATD